MTPDQGSIRPLRGRVYVDDAFCHSNNWGKWTGGGHLQADSVDDLHVFAARLGLKREWFQSKPGQPEMDHYDLTRSKREQALAMGAVAESWREAAKRNIRAMRARREASDA